MSEIKRYAHKSYIDTETMEQCLQCEFVEYSVGDFVKYEDHKSKVEQLENSSKAKMSVEIFELKEQNAKLVELVSKILNHLGNITSMTCFVNSISKKLNEILNEKEQG